MTTNDVTHAPAHVAAGGLSLRAMPLAWVTSAAAGLLALVAMVGWIGRWTALVQPDPTLPMMQFNAALLMLAAAVAVGLEARDARRAPSALGVLLLVFGGLTLYQFASGVNLGIDTLFLDPFVRNPRYPSGRMSQHAASAFTCIGIGLLAGRRRSIGPAAAVLASFMVLGLAGSALVRYAFGAGATSFRSGFGGMAMQTAIAFVLVAIGWLDTAWRRSRAQGRPFFAPSAAALAVLLATALLLETLAIAYPNETTRLVFATTAVLAVTMAALVFVSVRAAQVSHERAIAATLLLREKEISEERNRALFEQASAGIIEISASGRILRANDRFCAIVGRTLPTLQQLTLADITHPEDRAADRRHFAQGFADTLPAEGWTKRYLRPDGSIVWVRVSGSHVRARTDDEAETLLGVVQDVTELVEAQAAIARSRAHLVAFVEHAPAAVAMFDRELRYIAVSRRWKDDYGLGGQDLIGRHHYDVFPEIRDMANWRDIHQRCLAGAVERCDEDHFVRADGRDEWIQWEVRPWLDLKGEIGGLMMLTEVITPRKLAARALAESQQRLQLALSNARHGLWDWNLVTNENFVDDQYAASMGYDRSEFGGDIAAWERSIHPEDAPAVRAALDRALGSDDEVYDVDYRARTKRGGWLWVNTRGRVQERDAVGRPLRMMGTLHDISARKATEQQMRDALHTNEVLLREVHHRVKNNLAAIASLFYLQAQTTQDAAVLALLEDCRNRVYSMSLVHELLYRSANLAVVDLADYTSSLVRHLLSGQASPSAIRMVSRLESMPLEIDRAIPCGLVLNEMLTNALKHAFQGREGGTIEVTVEMRNGSCRLAVTDDGVGPPAREGATRTMGLRLMRALAGQLAGRFELTSRDDGPGARAVLEFAAEIEVEALPVGADA